MKIINPMRTPPPRRTPEQLLEQEICASLKYLTLDKDGDKNEGVSCLPVEKKQELLALIEPEDGNLMDFVDLFCALFPTTPLFRCRFMRLKLRDNPLWGPYGELFAEEIREYLEELARDENHDKNSWLSLLPTEKKKKLLALIEPAYPIAVEEDPVVQESEEYERLATFHLFRRLPLELKHQIWGEILGPLKPRVHTIKLHRRAKTFRSNQPFSPFLKICQESRSFYFQKTKTRLGFSNYVNFDIDTIHILDTENMPHHISRLVGTPGISQIQRFSMTSRLFDDTPMWKSAPRGSRAARGNNLQYVFLHMLAIKETTIVFDDKRDEEVCWKDHNVSFRTMSVNEKKRLPERSFHRYRVACLERALEAEVGDKLKFSHRFAYVNKKSSLQPSS